jgi:hypothetical protein
MNNDEKLAKQFLENYNLKVTLYSKSSKKSMQTPDFKVEYIDFFFLCEIKSIHTKTTKKGILFSTIYNRIVNKIEKANEQFKSVNSQRLVPNVLILISHNFQINFDTLSNLLKGGVIVDGEELANFIKYRDGKLKNIIWNFDLIIWLDENLKPDYLFLNNEKRISNNFIRIFKVKQINEKILIR